MCGEDCRSSVLIFGVIAESKWMWCTMALETDEFTAQVKDCRETLNMLGELKSHVHSWHGKQMSIKCRWSMAHNEWHLNDQDPMT